MCITEALAHTVRGMAIFFFIFWSVQIHSIRQRNRIMRLCYLLSVAMTISYAKDIIFVFDLHPLESFFDDLVFLIDMLCIPLICAFFCEITKPQGIKTWQVILTETIFLAFIGAYTVQPSHSYVVVAYGLGLCYILATLIAVTRYALRTKRFIAENFSYTENISVTWVVVVFTSYMLMYAIYFLSFYKVTWMKEVIFNLCCMVLWTFVYYYTVRQRIIQSLSVTGKTTEDTSTPDASTDILAPTADIAASTTEATAPPAEEAESPATLSAESLPPDAAPAIALSPAEHRTAWQNEMEQNLKHCMEKDRIFLQPRLSIAELSAAIGTNRTYLSQYLHDVLHITFYDYINSFRIEASCQLIREMAQNGTRINMAEIATKSGFNSTASFYRYFAKKQGISPSDYYERFRGENK